MKNERGGRMREWGRVQKNEMGMRKNEREEE